MIQNQTSAYRYYPPAAPPAMPTVPMAPAPVGPLPAAPQASFGQMLDQIHWMATQLAPVTVPTPQPLPAPSIVERLGKLVDRLTKPKSKPTAPPAPTPKEEPKAAEPKPQPKPPKPKPPAPKAPPADTTRYFHAQYRSASNSNEDAPSNGNCGPASLTMIAEAFKKISVTPASANAAIEATRKRMGAGTSQSDEYDGTSYEQLVRGAKSYGLDAKVYYGKLDVVKRELAKGRLVIAHLRPSYLFPGTTSGHYAVVTKVAGGKVYMNDPANPRGQTVLSEATFLRAQRERGAYGLISLQG